MRKQISTTEETFFDEGQNKEFGYNPPRKSKKKTILVICSVILIVGANLVKLLLSQFSTLADMNMIANKIIKDNLKSSKIIVPEEESESQKDIDDNDALEMLINKAQNKSIDNDMENQTTQTVQVDESIPVWNTDTLYFSVKDSKITQDVELIKQSAQAYYNTYNKVDLTEPQMLLLAIKQYEDIIEMCNKLSALGYLSYSV
jgi:hypothetical protein